MDVYFEAVTELAPAGDCREVHATVDLADVKIIQFFEPGARREVRSHAHDAGHLSIAASETHHVHSACDEGLAQFAAQPARRSSDQYGFDHFYEELRHLATLALPCD